jgi:hypothetical protein
MYQVVLPRLLSLYYRDFGPTQRDMLVYLRTYMDESMIAHRYHLLLCWIACIVVIDLCAWPWP